MKDAMGNELKNGDMIYALTDYGTDDDCDDNDTVYLEAELHSERIFRADSVVALTDEERVDLARLCESRSMELFDTPLAGHCPYYEALAARLRKEKP